MSSKGGRGPTSADWYRLKMENKMEKKINNFKNQIFEMFEENLELAVSI